LAVAQPLPAGGATDPHGEERSLVEAARAGDETAWSKLFDAHFHSLYVYALTRVHNHHVAEELAAQVFEEATRSIKRFRHRGVSIRAWLFAIARNVSADYLRRELRLPRAELPDLAEQRDSLSDLGIRTDFLAALRQLTEEQQQVIVLRFVSDLSVADCARALGKGEGAVKMAQARGLEKLRDIMRPEEGQ
jgi:RNA polymerase sigma-70 factor (ECF subfamily)